MCLENVNSLSPISWSKRSSCISTLFYIFTFVAESTPVTPLKSLLLQSAVCFKAKSTQKMKYFFNKNIYVHKYRHWHIGIARNWYHILNRKEGKMQYKLFHSPQTKIKQDLKAWSLGEFSIHSYKMKNKIFLCGAGFNDQQNEVWRRLAVTF